MPSFASMAQASSFRAQERVASDLRRPDRRLVHRRHRGRRQDHPFDRLRASLELKAMSALNKAHEAQAHNYPSPSLRTGLAATGLRLAILINFGAPSLQWKRIIR